MASDPHETAQNCYLMAYSVLPQTIFHEKEKVVRDLTSPDNNLEAFKYYFFTCRHRQVEPDPELIHQFSVHIGELREDLRYIIIQYPPPPPVNLLDPQSGLQGIGSLVLAPYFSALVERLSTNEIKYFTLGQSPDGHTTLRTVDTERNANLGRGWEPTLESFIELLKVSVQM